MSIMNRFNSYLVSLIKDILRINLTLFKVMIPTIVVVKILEEIGAIPYIAHLLSPFMALVGLPEEVSVIWAATILTTNYTGMLLFFQYIQHDPLSIAQTTVLASMMLMAHSLPVECAIARKAGVRVLYTVSLRIGVGLLMGWLLHISYSYSNIFQETNVLLWQPSVSTPDASLAAWVLEQLHSFVYIFLMIAGLVIGLRILKAIGLEALLKKLLRPLLRLTGIHADASNFTLVGMTLGLSFGGGLLIDEAKRGTLQPKDIFLSVSLLCLCHSLIEDTILMLMLGSDLISILLVRVVFSILIMMLIVRLYPLLSQTLQTRFLIVSGTR